MNKSNDYNGIAFDYIRNNLYILNAHNRSIEVYNIKTLAMTIFYFNDLVPNSITLVPEERYGVIKLMIYHLFIIIYKIIVFVNKIVIKKILYIKYCSKMYVAFLKEFSQEMKYFVYEMQMNGKVDKRKLMEGVYFKGSKISMCYYRDSKTLFMSDEWSNSILLHSIEGLHFSFYKCLNLELCLANACLNF